MNKVPHVLRWVAADAFVSASARSLPSILRFTGDDFMDRLLRLLDQRPQDIGEFVAVDSEGWQHQGPLLPGLPDPATESSSRAARALKRRTLLAGFRRQQQPVSTPLPDTPPIKLFQPVHQRYYLAAAHLVCEQPGLPPRKLSGGDRSAFVVRRLFAGIEHGYAKGDDGRGTWLPLGGPPDTTLAADEELLPVFPLAYAPPSGPARAMSAGLIPVARHNDYVFAGRAAAPPQPGADTTPAQAAQAQAEGLKALAVSQVVEPWQALVNLAGQVRTASDADADLLADVPWEKKNAGPNVDSTLLPALRELNLQLIEGSWRVLQGLREWLALALPDVAGALGSDTEPPGAHAAALHRLLTQARWPAPLPPDVLAALQPAATGLSVPASLRAALLAIGQPGDTVFDQLDAAEQRYPEGPGWPSFMFPLVLATVPTTPLTPTGGWPTLPRPADIFGSFEQAQIAAMAQATLGSAELVTLVKALFSAVDEAAAALRLGADTRLQAPAGAALARQLAGNGNAAPSFVLRFVHLRCDCGPLARPVISAPSAPFELAGFFDPDAPLRPLRIALPFDTTPGGLRKYAKNSSFIVSDLLCGQMKKVRKLGFVDLVLSVLPWPFHKKLKVTEAGPCGDADRFGMICSLSIPIITIVAFVLLIVIATLLDLIFRWMPFLMVCFPVPGLKGKKE